MPPNPFYGRTKAAEIKWLACSLTGSEQWKYNQNKSPQPSRSQILGATVWRKPPLKCLEISNTQQDHQLHPHWKERTFQNPQSPTCRHPVGGKRTGSRGLFGFPWQRRDPHPVLGQRTHYVLINVSQVWRTALADFQHASAYFPKKCGFPLHRPFQVVAKGEGEKRRINVSPKETSWSKPTAFCINLLCVDSAGEATSNLRGGKVKSGNQPRCEPGYEGEWRETFCHGPRCS